MDPSLRAVYDEVSKCNRCGFCQAHCPVYDITRREGSVARGHNAHVRKVIEGELALGPDFKDPLFQCLLCRSCVTNCFPAVQTDRNIVAARAEYLRRMGQPRLMRLLFRDLLPDPLRMANFFHIAAWGKNLGIGSLARELGFLKWFGKNMEGVDGIVERLPTRFFQERVPGLSLEPPQPRYAVTYFVGCGFNFALPHVAEATVAVLVHLGARVVLADNGCCGLPAYGYGDLEAARDMARRNIELLERSGENPVVTDCGSCSAFLKEYPELLEGEPALRERAERVARRVRGFSEFVHDRIPELEPTARPPTSVTYHDPCHLSRYQGVVRQPRDLLRAIPGLAYTELPEADRCCGAAGSYNVTQYEQSVQVLDRKMDNVKRTGARILATECPGCLIQLSFGARRSGLGLRVAHVSELLRDALVGRG